MRRVLIGTATAAVLGSLLASAPAQAAPTLLRTITGANTLLATNGNLGLGVGPDGQVYLAIDSTNGSVEQLVKFAAGAAGNVAPTTVVSAAPSPSVNFKRCNPGSGSSTCTPLADSGHAITYSNMTAPFVYGSGVNTVAAMGSNNGNTFYRIATAGGTSYSTRQTSVLSSVEAVVVNSSGARLVLNNSAVANGDRIYAFNTDSSQSIEYTAASGSSNLMGWYAMLGGANAGFSNPRSMDIDASDNIYVGDTGNGAANPASVRVFSSANVFGPSSSPSRVISGYDAIGGVADVAVDAQGYLYVADYVKNVIAVFEPTANGTITPLTTISTGTLSPYGVDLDSVGNVYVLAVDWSDTTRNAISVYSALDMSQYQRTPASSPDSPSAGPAADTGAGSSAGTGSSSSSAPSNEVAPAVVGDSAVGSTISGSAGEWSASVATTYQWFRCKKASAASSKKPKGCKVIKKAKKLNYKVVKKDKGKYLVLRVTAKGNKGTTVSYAASTAKVA